MKYILSNLATNDRYIGLVVNLIDNLLTTGSQTTVRLLTIVDVGLGDEMTVWSTYQYYDIYKDNKFWQYLRINIIKTKDREHRIFTVLSKNILKTMYNECKTEQRKFLEQIAFHRAEINLIP